MRTLIAATAFALLTACGSSTPTPGSLAATQLITTPQTDTRIVAVLSYASWCGSCKVLDPKVTAVRAANTFEGVEFFALDYSAKDSDAFYAAAETLGVADTMRAKFAGKITTGRLYLIDRDSGAILAEISQDMDEAAIVSAITAAAATA